MDLADAAARAEGEMEAEAAPADKAAGEGEEGGVEPLLPLCRHMGKHPEHGQQQLGEHLTRLSCMPCAGQICFLCRCISLTNGGTMGLFSMKSSELVYSLKLSYILLRR